MERFKFFESLNPLGSGFVYIKAGKPKDHPQWRSKFPLSWSQDAGGLSASLCLSLAGPSSVRVITPQPHAPRAGVHQTGLSGFHYLISASSTQQRGSLCLQGVALSQAESLPTITQGGGSASLCPYLDPCDPPILGAPCILLTYLCNGIDASRGVCRENYTAKKTKSSLGAVKILPP